MGEGLSIVLGKGLCIGCMLYAVLGVIRGEGLLVALYEGLGVVLCEGLYVGVEVQGCGDSLGKHEQAFHLNVSGECVRVTGLAWIVAEGEDMTGSVEA